MVDISNCKSVNWVKGKRAAKFTQRSKLIQKHQQSIQSTPKRQNTVKKFKFIIENDPIIEDYIYNKKHHAEMQRDFVVNIKVQIDPCSYIDQNKDSKRDGMKQ